MYKPTVAFRHAEESLSESDVKRIDCLCFLSTLFNICYRLSPAWASTTIFFIITLHSI